VAVAVMMVVVMVVAAMGVIVFKAVSTVPMNTGLLFERFDAPGMKFAGALDPGGLNTGMWE